VYLCATFLREIVLQIFARTEGEKKDDTANTLRNAVGILIQGKHSTKACALVNNGFDGFAATTTTAAAAAAAAAAERRVLRDTLSLRKVGVLIVHFHILYRSCLCPNMPPHSRNNSLHQGITNSEP
jgi:hypothetical protein